MTTVEAVAVAAVCAFALGPVVAHMAAMNMRAWTRGCDAAVVAGAGLAVTELLAKGAATAAVGLPLALVGIAAAIVDVHEQRLPDALTGTLLIGTTVAVAVSAPITDDGVAAAARAALAAVLVTSCGLLAKAARSSAIGWGDIKLLPSLGEALGWAGWDHLTSAAVLWVLFLVVTTAAASWPRSDRQDLIPYGPALVVGGLGALAAGA
jgi:prepilin signal peptidase PulO-like enzyme (type II secretory pathway)